jgi:CelD/BcsL family acetyltransferase involved in cellulose biosynthesis
VSWPESGRGLPDGPEIEEISTAAGLEALQVEWLALWDGTAAATPFQSPAWLLPWWRWFGNDELLTLALRSRGCLVGLVPLYVHRDGDLRKLLPLGIGVSDYLDPLLEPHHADAVLRRLARRADRFDRIDLENLRLGSPLLEANAPGGWRARAHAGEPCPVLALPEAGAPLAKAVPRLAKLPYYLRRAERLGAANLELASADTLAEFLDALFELHGARWQGRGERGVLADPTVRAFHREAAESLLALGRLRLHGLRVGGRLVAVFHGFADRSRLHAYLGGFDPTVPHPGLGALMIGHAVQAAAREGLRELHFLRGREAYKYAWGATDRPSWGRRLDPTRDDSARLAEVERPAVP